MVANYLKLSIQERKKYFWQILIVIFIETKISGKSISFILLFIWTKLKLQNLSKQLLWIKTIVKISKSGIKKTDIQLFDQKKIFLCILCIFVHFVHFSLLRKKWSEPNGLKMINYAKLKSKLVNNIFSFLNFKCQVVCNYELTAGSGSKLNIFW